MEGNSFVDVGEGRALSPPRASCTVAFPRISFNASRVLRVFIIVGFAAEMDTASWLVVAAWVLSALAFLTPSARRLDGHAIHCRRSAYSERIEFRLRVTN